MSTSVHYVQTSLILVTGACRPGSVGSQIVELLLKKNLCVRALVTQKDDHAKALEALGAQVVIGDLTDLADVNRVLSDAKTLFFSHTVSESYLETALTTIAVAKHVGVTTFVNLSQLSVSHMDVTHTTESTQQKQYWLVEQVLKWSGIPTIQLRPTIHLEHPFFTQFARHTILEEGKISLPFENGCLSPIASEDIARVAAEILAEPNKHIGKVYELTGPTSLDMKTITSEFSNALDRVLEYEDVPIEGWMQKELMEANMPAHLENHIAAMARMIQRGCYGRHISDCVKEITGSSPLSVEDWVKSNQKLFVTESQT